MKAKKKYPDKYLKGSSNKGERKKLMDQIASIYEKYRGGDKKRPFPPEVKKRLNQLMKRRDKI